MANGRQEIEDDREDPIEYTETATCNALVSEGDTRSRCLANSPPSCTSKCVGVRLVGVLYLKITPRNRERPLFLLRYICLKGRRC